MRGRNDFFFDEIVADRQIDHGPKQIKHPNRVVVGKTYQVKRCLKKYKNGDVIAREDGYVIKIIEKPMTDDGLIIAKIGTSKNNVNLYLADYGVIPYSRNGKWNRTNYLVPAD
jgi:hypothetical protein